MDCFWAVFAANYGGCFHWQDGDGPFSPGFLFVVYFLFSIDWADAFIHLPHLHPRADCDHLLVECRHLFYHKHVWTAHQKGPESIGQCFDDVVDRLDLYLVPELVVSFFYL